MSCRNQGWPLALGSGDRQTEGSFTGIDQAATVPGWTRCTNQRSNGARRQRLFCTSLVCRFARGVKCNLRVLSASKFGPCRKLRSRTRECSPVTFSPLLGEREGDESLAEFSAQTVDWLNATLHLPTGGVGVARPGRGNLDAGLWEGGTLLFECGCSRLRSVDGGVDSLAADALVGAKKRCEWRGASLARLTVGDGAVFSRPEAGED